MLWKILLRITLLLPCFLAVCPQWDSDREEVDPGPGLNDLAGKTSRKPEAAQELEPDEKGSAQQLPPAIRNSSSTPSAMQSERSLLADLHSALPTAWGGEDHLVDETLWGICDEIRSSCSTDSSQVLRLLAQGVATEAQRKKVQILQPTKELWEMEVESERTRLILHFMLPPSLHKNKSPILLFFLSNTGGKDDLIVTFVSHALHPHQQKVCLSPSTRFIALTGGVSRHTAWHISVEAKESEGGAGLSLSELQELLMKKSSGLHNPPVILLVDRRTDEKQDMAEHVEHKTSESFLFLCELRVFLTEATSHPELSPGHITEPHPLSQDALGSLPSIPLNSSSGDALLQDLMNSSAPVLFSFPHHMAALREHRVSLALPPHLLLLLRLQLSKTLDQLVKEMVGGRAVRDRLRRLKELSAIPEDHQEAADTGERQYRTLLLLKAMQTVLQAWAIERSQRAARGGPEVSSQGNVCRLQSLTISTKSMLYFPSTLTINNCHGICKYPLVNGNSHSILLIKQLDSGVKLERAPCCVPLQYEEMMVMHVNGDGMNIVTHSEMVATECGCR